MNSCRSTLIVDVYDVVPWQLPGGATFHGINGAKLSWLAVCILAVMLPCFPGASESNEHEFGTMTRERAL